VEGAGTGLVQQSGQDLASWKYFLYMYCARGGKSWLCRTYQAHCVEAGRTSWWKWTDPFFVFFVFVFACNSNILLCLLVFGLLCRHTASNASYLGNREAPAGLQGRRNSFAWREIHGFILCATPSRCYSLPGK